LLFIFIELKFIETNVISRQSYRGETIDLCKIVVRIAFDWARLQHLKSLRRFSEKQTHALRMFCF